MGENILICVKLLIICFENSWWVNRPMYIYSHFVILQQQWYLCKFKKCKFVGMVHSSILIFCWCVSLESEILWRIYSWNVCFWSDTVTYYRIVCDTYSLLSCLIVCISFFPLSVELQNELQRARQDKKRLRKVLKEFEDDFFHQSGR